MNGMIKNDVSIELNDTVKYLRIFDFDFFLSIIAHLLYRWLLNCFFLLFLKALTNVFPNFLVSFSIS